METIVESELISLELRRDHFLRVLAGIGESLLLAGAEISRVEDTLNRMAKRFGARSVDCFAITSTIIITISFEETINFSQTRRIRRPAGSNFEKIEQINDLSRRYCSGELSTAEMEQEFKRIEHPLKLRSKEAMYIGSALVAGGNAVFFGGNIFDGLVAFIAGMIVFLLQDKLEGLCANKMMFNLICSFVVGCGICFVAGFTPMLHLEKIISGEIMLLIPGVALTISIKDVITGETLSGVLRLTESLSWAVALAIGYMLSMLLLG